MDKKMIIGNVETGAMWKPVGYKQVTNSAAVIDMSVTTMTPTDAKWCTLQAEVTTIRFTDVTTASPSTAIGQILHPGIAPMAYGGDPRKLQIWVTAGAVNVLFYK